jgi:hypothetical protein
MIQDFFNKPVINIPKSITEKTGINMSAILLCNKVEVIDSNYNFYGITNNIKLNKDRLILNNLFLITRYECLPGEHVLSFFIINEDKNRAIQIFDYVLTIPDGKNRYQQLITEIVDVPLLSTGKHRFEIIAKKNEDAYALGSLDFIVSDDVVNNSQK